jgi:prepilin-type N-terminal cleavage/methylation domain-containing protein
MNRRGFTLIEVMVALVATSTILAVGYTALTGTIDTRDRLRAHRADAERLVRAESLLRDALRHVVAADQVDEPPLRLVRGDVNGRAADSLIVLTRGVDPLLGAGRLWRVVVASDANGTAITAIPLLRADETPTLQPPRLIARLDAYAGVRVTVLDRIGSVDWRAEWPDAISLPVAVAVAFQPRDRARAIAPFVVRLTGPGIA